MINVNITCTGRGWILKKMVDKIVQLCPNDIKINFGTIPIEQKNCINYYMPYTRFKEKTKGFDVPFFTHPENTSFFAKALRADYCVVMCEKYKKELIQKGVHKDKVIVIYPGTDHEKFKPTLKVLQTVKMESEKRKGRKGYDLWKRVSSLPFVECICTEGNYTDEEIIQLYKNTDVVLSTSMVEGGPMCVLEGLAMGKTVVAPTDVGFVDDLNGIIKYNRGNFKQVRKILGRLYNTKLEISKNVEKYTWEKWADDHYQLFRRINK